MSSSPPKSNIDADLISHADAVKKKVSNKRERIADAAPDLVRSQSNLNGVSPDNLLGDRLLTDRAVADLFSVSRQTVWRWARSNNLFPKAIQISPGTSRWRLSDIRSYLADIGAETNKEEAK